MKKLLFILFISILFTQTTNVLALDKYTLLEPLPCVSGVGNCTEGTLQTEISFQDYVGYVFKFSIALAVFLAIVVIIYAGFEYMLSEALPTKLDAKGRIKSAITGLILVFASYLILRVIDPRLVQIYTEIPPVNFVATTETQQFNKNITEDLKNINAEALKKVNTANEEKNLAQEKISDAEKKLKNGEINENDYQILKATELETIRKKNIEISREITGTFGRNSIKNLSIDLRISPETNWYGATNPDWTLVDKKIEEVNKLYDKYIVELQNSNNPEGVSILRTDRVFYVDQLREEGEMIKEVDKSYQDQTVKSRDAVAKRLKSYQEEYASYSTDPRLEEQYKNLLEIRIAYLRDYLEKSAKVIK
jgi:hypothetical protein